MNLLTSQLLEITNGVLLPVLAFMFLGALYYILAERWMLFGSWREVYRFRKGGIALAVFLLGLMNFIFPPWMERHAANHGYTIVPLSDYLLFMRMFGTIAATIGGLCWLRVTLWREEFGPKGWIWLGLVSVTFGVGMAMRPEDMNSLLELLRLVILPFNADP